MGSHSILCYTLIFCSDYNKEINIGLLFLNITLPFLIDEKFFECVVPIDTGN